MGGWGEERVSMGRAVAQVARVEDGGMVGERSEGEARAYFSERSTKRGQRRENSFDHVFLIILYKIGTGGCSRRGKYWKGQFFRTWNVRDVSALP